VISVSIVDMRQWEFQTQRYTAVLTSASLVVDKSLIYLLAPLILITHPLSSITTVQALDLHVQTVPDLMMTSLALMTSLTLMTLKRILMILRTLIAILMSKATGGTPPGVKIHMSKESTNAQEARLVAVAFSK